MTKVLSALVDKNGTDAFAAGGGSPIADGNVMGNNAGITTAPYAIPFSELVSVLPVFTNAVGTTPGTQGLVPLVPGSLVGNDLYLRRDGSWIQPPAGTPANDSITNAKLADMATMTIKGNLTGATGDPVDHSMGVVTAALNVFTDAIGATPGLKGLVPAVPGSLSGTEWYLRKDGTWATPAGGGGGAADPLPLATEVVTDQPAGGVPATGIKLFTASRASRKQPAWISPVGRTERMQGFMGANDCIFVDVPAGGTGYSLLGSAMAADIGTATTPAITITNLLTMQVRRVLAVAATANLMMESKASAPWCSRRLVGGGFHFTMRFGLETVMPATGRLFAGLTGLTTAIATGDPSTTLANSIGLFKSTADTTLRFMTSQTAGSPSILTLTNTGAVGWNVAGTMFQLELFVTPGEGSFGYRITRYTPNGVNAPTVVYDDGRSITSSSFLPVIDTLFVPHLWAQNVAATAMSIAFIQAFKESD